MNCPPSNIKFQLRRATALQWSAVSGTVLQAGEPGFEIDTFKLKIGDGITPWTILPYIGSVLSQIGETGPTGPPGNTTAYIFDGGNSTSSYILGPAFDCGSSI
jgi:hypothetical protein